MPDEGACHRRVTSYHLDFKDSHLNVFCDLGLKEQALEKLITVYGDIERYIQKDPFFGISYTPVTVDMKAPKVVREMADAAAGIGVGPMAAVAGAVAEAVGRRLLELGAKEVVVENGGDIYLKLHKVRTVGIHAGGAQWSNKLALKVRPSETPLGICTSSATVGPSINLGEADAVTVVAPSTALSDAAATAVGNRVKGRNGLQNALSYSRKIPGILGVLVIKGGELAVWGKLPEIVGRDFTVKR
jgi:ApbE superfamily uncharacterized protein (UPF0280 family)